mmetsp:Transcript_110433/g.330309  ORF Transcript_110433/g.330309 Transcript_110433/m.330309 type:complete len:201 (+) Transcript_110433:1261-1863(+)
MKTRRLGRRRRRSSTAKTLLKMRLRRPGRPVQGDGGAARRLPCGVGWASDRSPARTAQRGTRGGRRRQRSSASTRRCRHGTRTARPSGSSPRAPSPATPQTWRPRWATGAWSCCWRSRRRCPRRRRSPAWRPPSGSAGGLGCSCTPRWPSTPRAFAAAPPSTGAGGPQPRVKSWMKSCSTACASGRRTLPRVRARSSCRS